MKLSKKIKAIERKIMLENHHSIFDLKVALLECVEEAKEIEKNLNKLKEGRVIISLPNNFKQLPEKLQCKLVRKHTHAELVDGEKIVYEEQDLLDIIKYVSEGNYR